MISEIQNRFIYPYVLKAANTAWLELAQQIQKLATYFFFMGFSVKQDSPKLLANRSYLQDKGRLLDISGIDALHIPSQASSKTGNVIVFCLTSFYERYHFDKHWKPFLDNGADIVLWNPTQIYPHVMKEDLSKILAHLRKNNSDQIIVVKSMCAATDPAIHAVAGMDDPNIHMMIDRGFGDVNKLARSLTICAALPPIKNILKNHFDCQGIQKIKAIQGRILFMIPEQDSLLDQGSENLTKDLANKAQKPSLLTLKTRDHWANWDYEAYNGIFEFLKELNVINNNPIPVEPSDFPRSQDTWGQTQLFPFLIKSWC